MPHAALYVVQREKTDRTVVTPMFQCRTQHCMWCNLMKFWTELKFRSFNAARSIVCGATKKLFLHMMRDTEFQCRTQHCMWCNTARLNERLRQFGFNAARSIVGGATTCWKGTSSNRSFNAARSIVCGATSRRRRQRHGLHPVSMPHAALYVVQLHTFEPVRSEAPVSMPHAALYVVQLTTRSLAKMIVACFNAARSIVCGATPPRDDIRGTLCVSMPHAALYVVQQRAVHA